LRSAWQMIWIRPLQLVNISDLLSRAPRSTPDEGETVGLPRTSRHIFCSACSCVRASGHSCFNEKETSKSEEKKQQQVEQRNFENQTRSSDGMKTVIEDVLALAVPPFLAAMISEMRLLVREMTPHKATISRFRMMVDAAFIYYQRPP
jgi:hypothetical protein